MKKEQGSFVLRITCTLMLVWFCHLNLTTVDIVTVFWLMKVLINNCMAHIVCLKIYNFTWCFSLILYQHKACVMAIVVEKFILVWYLRTYITPLLSHKSYLLLLCENERCFVVVGNVHPVVMVRNSYLFFIL